MSVGTSDLAGRSVAAKIIMAIFFAQAFSGGSLTTRIADFQSNLGLSESQLGLALLGAPVAGIISYLVSGRIVERLGTRAVFLLCLPAVAVFTWVNAMAIGPITLFLAGFAFGIPWSIANVAMNVEADRHEAASGRRIMNLCHGWWSAGWLITALIAVLARNWQISPADHFVWFIPATLFAVWFLVDPMTAAPTRVFNGNKTVKKMAWPTLSVVTLVGFGLAGGIAQSAATSWSVIYMRDTFVVADWVDTLSLVVFVLTLTAGRMFADGWNTRFGPAAVTIVLISTALIGVIAVVLAGNYVIALAGFGLIGFGVCALYPVMISAAAKTGDRPASENVAAVNLLIGLAMLLVPPMMGFAAEQWGIRAAFAIIVPSFLVTLALARRVGAQA